MICYRSSYEKKTCFARAHTSAIDRYGPERGTMGAENMDRGPIIGDLDASKIKLLDSTTPAREIPNIILI